MTDKSYQVIEPSLIGKWMGTVKHEGALFSLLSWLVYLLLSRKDEKLSNIEIKIICVEYNEKYPTIGAHYKNPEDDDLEDYIISLIEGYLLKKPAIEFINFYFNNEEEWEYLYTKFISQSP
ncbi:hypothetical protein [Zooshikella ganghwensis]|uniref:Uncharacterized protein n=1 Tax=Zooshikella ganghwensis TaxID=202772 RepID=A0A4P9VGD0_9GAMM|nr:hypothetical protein [Zooshikella ganghwensis]RDH42195.1 hypothetical protein B9G39_01340 [Zooshikella ganghwensis]